MFVQTLRRFNNIIVKERKSFIPSEARFTSETFEESSPDKLGGCCRYYLTDKYVRSCHDCAIIVLCHAFLWNATFVIGKYIFSVKLNNELTYFFSFFQSFSIHTSKSKRKICKGRRYLVCIKQIYQSRVKYGYQNQIVGMTRFKSFYSFYNYYKYTSALNEINTNSQ